jgi:hypothetical protein
MKKSNSTQAHDQNFKELIELFFKEFLEFALPEHYLQIDFEQVHFLKQEYFGDKPKHKRVRKLLDVVASVKIHGELSHILIHVEHQSTRERDFAKRMFQYFCHLWLKHQVPIYPIAIFSDDTVWKRRVESYFEFYCMAKQIVRFDFQMIKLKDLNWRHYLHTENPVAIALMSKMNFKKSERPYVKAEILRLLVTGKVREHPKSYFLRNFMEHYLDLNPEESIIYEQEAEKFIVEPEVKEMILARPFQQKYDEGIEKGLQLGIEQGREQGIEKGIEQGKLETVTKMLAKGCKWDFIEEVTGISEDCYRKHFLNL